MNHFNREIIVDNFAGGGGASTGISVAIGRSVDIAINHDPQAIAMHKANHPDTEHYCESVWEVDPIKAVRGRPVALCWFSPDCKHFSKAKGGKPVEKKVRGLAWVAVRWAAKVHPRVIILENVEEFKTWGPLTIEGMPDPNKKGETFNTFINALKKQGYKVEWRELRACDYGAPTIRKRFFLIARCDGMPIVWPEPTHCDPNKTEAILGTLKPWKTAAEIIDWDINCPSIFDRKKPLAENTMKRIAKGIQKFVFDNPNPFIVQVNYSGANHHYCRPIESPLATITSKNGFSLITPILSQIGQTGGGDRLHDIQEPLSTIVTKQEHLLVTPFLTQYHSYDDSARGQELEKPILTVDTSNRYGLVSAFISKYYAGCSRSTESDLNGPLHTITARQGHALVTAYVAQHYKTSTGHEVTSPLGAITTVNKASLVTAFLLKYYGSDVGLDCNSPLHTVTTKDRFGLVTIHGEDYQIVDIGMRMLEPHELFAAQGFPENYTIDKDFEGKPYPKTAQVARCGNAVPPPFAEALTRANLPELCGEIDAEELEYLLS